MYEVLFYENQKGDCPTGEFLDSLPLKVQVKVEKWIEKLEQEGPRLPRPYADTVRGKVRGQKDYHYTRLLKRDA